MFTREKLEYQAIDVPDRFDVSAGQSLDGVTAFYEYMRKRHTVRDFSDKPVSKEVIETCIKIAGTAPSGANHQPWHFVAISNPEHKRKFARPPNRKSENFTQVAQAMNGSRRWNPLAPMITNHILRMRLG